MTAKFRSLLYVGPLALAAAACAPTPEEQAAEHAAMLDRYCTECHNEIDREGGLVLEDIDTFEVAANAEVWEKVVMKLHGNLMPPPGGPRPGAERVDELVDYLVARLDAGVELVDVVGRSTIHRLNRSEYGNAVRDLIGFEIDPAEYLPADDEGYGFDNMADILRVSPSLLDQYLSASSKIAALAVGDLDTRPVSAIYRAPPDLAQDDHIEGLPLGTRGGLVVEHYFPLDAEYDFSVFLRRNIVGYMTGLEWPHELEILIDGETVFSAPVGGEADNAASDENFSAAANAIDERLRARVPVEAGLREVGVTFVRRNSAETHEPLELHTRDLDLQNMNGLPVVDYVNLIGPFEPSAPGETASRERIFSCEPESPSEELPCAETILSDLAYRAFRRPITERDLGLLLELYEAGRSNASFERGIQNALRAILTSAEFLFRKEPDPEGAAPGSIHPVDEYSLASRLSFFLWSSVPDTELLELAEARRLSDPEVYRAQIERMLADPRAFALVENFASQWLFLRNLQSARPDVATFPNFDENLRRALGRETELFIESIIREDRSVLELLTADYTFLNERLAKHYGIDGIYGSHFRRVEIEDDARRGLLGQGSILTVTSYPNRTSPVLRGKFVMENLLGTPPPAPPPDVPALEENEPGRQARSVRERLERHREDPVCASCHDVMDPIGLALENFDAVGRWRTREPGGAVDASGELVGGRPVNGPIDLREAILEDPERFASVLAEKLLIYALGRGLSHHDMPTVRSIVRQAAEHDYRFSSLIEGIATSPQFRMKRVQPAIVSDATPVARAESPGE